MNKFHALVLGSAVAATVAAGSAFAAPIQTTIHSSDGAGGESYVLGFSSTWDNNINGSVWAVGGGGSRKAYVKFDMSSKPAGSISAATFRLTTESAEPSAMGQEGDSYIEVWGIVNGYAGGNNYDGVTLASQRPDLSETVWLSGDGGSVPANPQAAGSQYLTWNNAPGNNANVNQQIAASAAYGGVPLGTITVANATPGGTQFDFSNAALMNFLNTDTNGFVTLVLGLSAQSQNVTFNIRPRDIGPAVHTDEPMLIIDTIPIPEPASICLLALGGLMFVTCRKSRG